MTMHARKLSAARKAVVRHHTALLSVGLGASLVLVTGATLGAAGPSSARGDVSQVNATGPPPQVLKTQAEGQRKAAVAKAAEEAAHKRTAEKAAADRKKRIGVVKAVNPNAWVKPVDSYVKGPTFGVGGAHWARKHSGQDFAVPTGTPVKAVHTGTVVEAGWGGAYGNNIVIKHGAGDYTQYAHLSKLKVRAGQAVKTGQEIAKAGSTGNSTGPHLHFETRTAPVYGYAIEPVKFMRSKGVIL